MLSRMARKRKPVKKRRGKGSTDSGSSFHNSVSSEHTEMENSLVASEDVDLLNCTVIHVDAETESRRSRVGSEGVVGDEDGEESILRLPKMTDTSMDTVGKPLCDVMDRLNGDLDRGDAWEHLDEEDEEKNKDVFTQDSEPPAQQPFRTDSRGEPPDRAPSETTPTPPATSPNFLQTSPTPAAVRCFAPFGPDAASSGGGHHDTTEHGQSQTHSGGLEDEGEAKAAAGQRADVKSGEEDADGGQETDMSAEEVKEMQEEKLSPSEVSHPAEFK